MSETIDLKSIVKQKYSEVVKDEGCGCCGTARNQMDTSFVSVDEYQKLDGYVPEADYSLGCGVPTKDAEISSGDTVLDLGSGAGNDAFIVQKLVGEKGQVVGLDFTDDMISKANENKAKLGISNIMFVKGDIEEMPLESDFFDVVISNCVLNLVPDKQKAFSEMYRVLKPGAHFCVSDIVSDGQIPEQLKESAELYAGCVAGALPREAYLEHVNDAGFTNLQIRRERVIDVPENVVSGVLSPEEKDIWETSGAGLVSITLFAEKP